MFKPLKLHIKFWGMPIYLPIKNKIMVPCAKATSTTKQASQSKPYSRQWWTEGLGSSIQGAVAEGLGAFDMLGDNFAISSRWISHLSIMFFRCLLTFLYIFMIKTYACICAIKTVHCAMHIYTNMSLQYPFSWNVKCKHFNPLSTHDDSWNVDFVWFRGYLTCTTWALKGLKRSPKIGYIIY